MSLAWPAASLGHKGLCAGKQRAVLVQTQKYACNGEDVPPFSVGCMLRTICGITIRRATLTRSAAMSAQLKVKKAREFLQKGNRVRVVVAFPGRRGFEDAKRMLATLVEQVPRTSP